MLIWLVIAVLAALGELVTYDLALASVAAAAVVVAVLALVLPPALQVTIFAGLSLVGIALLRPTLKRTLGIGGVAPDAEGGPGSRLAGRRGIITQVTDGDGGQIRMGAGEFWSARSFDPTDTLLPGQSAAVLLVEGLTALVDAVPVARILPEVETAASSRAASPIAASETTAPTEKWSRSC